MINASWKSLGICVGASSIKVVELAGSAGTMRVLRTRVVNHNCNPRAALDDVLREYPPHGVDYVCVTGRKFKDLVNLPTVTEPEATEQALAFLFQTHKQPCHALLSLGAENFVLYELGDDGMIIGVHTGNKCASGTGEFFLQQIRRMDISLQESSRAVEGVDPYRVSGRCSVFCKSDCTHALNKGIPKDRVCAGLGNMIADKATEIFGSLARKNVLAVGGVTKNKYVAKQLRGQIENLVVPEHADVFEALGAAVHAAREKTTMSAPVRLASVASSFSTLAPLADAQHLVTFQEQRQDKAVQGDVAVLGLDVGSTTTKAVLMRLEDDHVLASIYLRTNGNPIRASRDCYQAIREQLGDTAVKITALGVTGSGRYISALHAQTQGIVNEIIAHANAAAHYDEEVDTILEIGGQDAKYTYLINGVPCDYAMNEACSAGTGSFLEEAAKESLGVDVREIQEIAIRATSPPNFNDQCAAFIGSDIKNASHEIARDDIIAGLVYSICMNYDNRVKGSRKVGRKVFMQGGVCYNKAVPLAMATLLQKPIIVPPEPGLMGAFGAALEMKQRMELGVLEADEFDLVELADRDAQYGKSFTCPGTTENCDRACIINTIKLNGKTFPFGGICNKYYNATRQVRIDAQPLDFVKKRQDALFGLGPDESTLAAIAAEAPAVAGNAKSNGRPKHGRQKAQVTIGITRSFLTNLLYPLYSHFFTNLGLKIVLSDGIDPEGMARTYSSFCFPAEIAHGMMLNLIKKEPDYIFLPQVGELYVEQAVSRKPGHQSTCIMAHAESLYLRSAFKDIKPKILSPELNWSKGWRSTKSTFVAIAKELGRFEGHAEKAFSDAVDKQEEFFAARKRLGAEALRRIESDPDQIGVIIFGRPYNAFADEANMGIPRKFASRGVHCVPFDCLPFHDQPATENMTWAIGQDLIRAANFVKKHRQLFGAFVTNFSCGPDSFVVGYFRDIMKTKPSLTLEIDNHTADAGVNTRIEAFLDIVQRYRKMGIADPTPKPFQAAKLEFNNGKSAFIASDGGRYPLKDPRVKIIFPSMGRTTSEVGAAIFQGLGFQSEAVRLPDVKTLMTGKANSGCKECLPLILTVGSMIEYVEKYRPADELTAYFMPTANGNCRFPQYYVYMDKLVKKRQIKDFVTFTLSTENSYGGLGPGAALKMLRGIVVSDVMDDVKNAIYTLAVDRDQAIQVFDREWAAILKTFRGGGKGIERTLLGVAERLAEIPLRKPLAEATRVLMAGEIYVRKDEFSSQRVIERLAEREIVVQRSPMLEWIHYIDYWTKHIQPKKLTLREKVELKLRAMMVHRIERTVKQALARSGLYEVEMGDIEEVIEIGEHFVDRSFGGETILVVGRFFKDILHDFHGMISIGPFACLPTRVIEAILTPESRTKGNNRLRQMPNAAELEALGKLPFLSIESDGNPFPQIVEAQLEAFCLQVERLREKVGPVRSSLTH